MSYTHDEMFEIAADVLHETDRAWKISDGTKEYWLPKSQCEFTPSSATREHGVFDVPVWLAKEKGLI